MKINHEDYEFCLLKNRNQLCHMEKSEFNDENIINNFASVHEVKKPFSCSICNNVSYDRYYD